MDPATVQADLGAWIDAHWDPDIALFEWRERLVDSGWAVPSWERRWGGLDLPEWADGVVAGELAARGLPHLPVGVGVPLAIPTLRSHGSEELQDRLLRPTLTGAATWCQLFSEPGAGSDLAGLSARAERDGDQWVVHGEKVWNTSAHHAEYGLLLARTDPEAPQHQGITYFVLPMRQAGVEVRPIRQMNHHASFNQVYLTDAVVPAGNEVGDVGGGWTVALTTLTNERRFGAMRPPSYGAAVGRAVEEARVEAARHFETYKWYPQRAGRVDLLVEHARSSDPLVRQEVARTISLQKVGTWTRAHGSIGKLTLSHVARQAARTHSLVAGMDALDGIVAEILLSVPAQSIAGGTDEIQRTILGERVLGLPKEPS